MAPTTRRVTTRVPCDHFNSYGTFCKRCGARKLLLGVGYELGWIEVERKVEVPCDHDGEMGEVCPQCGGRLGTGDRRAPRGETLEGPSA